MKKNSKLIVTIIIAVVLFAGTIVLYNVLSNDYKADNMSDGGGSGVTAPDFIAENENESDVSFSSYFGKPIVLNLWASWCSPCKEEMPYFEQAYKDNSDIRFLMVNMTTGDSKSDAKAFINDNGYTFPVLYDIYGEAAVAYEAQSLPMTFFIDKNGELVTYAVGALSEQQLQEGIDLIKE